MPPYSEPHPQNSGFMLLTLAGAPGPLGHAFDNSGFMLLTLAGAPGPLGHAFNNSGSPTERQTAPRTLRPVPLHVAPVLLGLSAPHHSILPSIPLESYHWVCLLQGVLLLPFGVCSVAGEGGESRGREPC